MKVEKAARELVDLLLSSLDIDIVLESTAVSGRATPAITIAVPKKQDIADLDLKPGIVANMHTHSLTVLYNIFG